MQKKKLILLSHLLFSSEIMICALGYQTSMHKIIHKRFMVQVVNLVICKMLTQVSQHRKLDLSVWWKRNFMDVKLKFKSGILCHTDK